MRRSVQLRRVITGMLAATTTVALTAACGSSGPGTAEPGKPGKVQVWALQDAAVNPIATASIDAYNKATGNKIELVTYVNDAYKQKLQVAMGSPAAPDGIAATIWLLIVAVPVYFVVITGFRGQDQYIDLGPLDFPTSPTLANFTALRDLGFTTFLTQSQEQRVLPLGLWNFQNQYGTNVPGLMAAVVLSALPVLALYLFGRRHLLSGLAAGFGK